MDNGEYTKEVIEEEGEFLALMNGNVVGYYTTRGAAETALSLMAINFLRRHR